MAIRTAFMPRVPRSSSKATRSPLGDPRRSVGDVEKYFSPSEASLMKPYPFEEVKYSTRPLRGSSAPVSVRRGTETSISERSISALGPIVLRRGMKHAVFIDVSQHILETAAAGAHALLLFLLLVLTLCLFKFFSFSLSPM